MGIAVRLLREEDRPDWERLYEGYAAFYKVTQTPEMRQTVWSWIMDPSKEVEGLAALDEAGTLHRDRSLSALRKAPVGYSRRLPR